MRRLLLVLIPSLALSQETILLPLSEAIKMAIENSIELQIARDKIESGEQRVYQERSQLLPKLGLELKSRYEKKEEIESYWVEAFGERVKVSAEPSPDYNDDLYISLNQRLYSGGEITGKIKQAKIQKEYLEYEKELVEQELILLITKAYWELKRSILQTEIGSKKLGYFKKMKERAEKDLELGCLSEAQLRDIEEKAVKAEDEFSQAEAEERRLKERLINLLNIEGSISYILIDEPEIRPLETDIASAVSCALTNNIKLKEQETVSLEKKIALTLAKSTRYPQAWLSGSLDYSGKANVYRQSWDNLKKQDWNMGVNLSWTFYDGGLLKRRIKEGEIELKIAKDEYEMTKREIVQGIKETFQRIQKAEERCQRLNKSISLAKERLETSCLQHRMGNITEDDVEKLEIELSEAETYLMEVKIGYEIAKAELNKLIGIKGQ